MIYDYECLNCGLTKEEYQNISDPKLTICPKCLSDKYTRLISGRIQFGFGTGLKDKCGQSIHFPKDQKAYFDQAARRVFHSPSEKKAWMDKNNIIENPYEEKHYEEMKKELFDTQADERRKQDAPC